MVKGQHFNSQIVCSSVHCIAASSYAKIAQESIYGDVNGQIFTISTALYKILNPPLIGPTNLALYTVYRLFFALDLCVWLY